MVYHGKVKNGTIVLDGDLRLPEGMRVSVSVAVASADQEMSPSGDSLSATLLKHAASCDGLPHDLARNHDYYIHGTPRE